jgi:hypothetical protein
MSRPELSPALVLNHGLTFAELFTPEGLQKIDGLFLIRLRERDAKAHDSLRAWRAGKETLTPLQVSELLLACGPVLDDFISSTSRTRSKPRAAARWRTIRCFISRNCSYSAAPAGAC